MMNAVNEDRFVVFVRTDHNPTEPPRDTAEQPVATCSTYQEARLIRRACQASGGEFVIRFIGPAGGGD